MVNILDVESAQNVLEQKCQIFLAKIQMQCGKVDL